MKTILSEIETWQADYMTTACHNQKCSCTLVTEHIDIDNVARYADAEIISCFICSDFSRPVLEKLPKLKFITTRSTGYNHIDLAYCDSHGIVVSNVPAYGTHTVAEHVFALLLSISRHIPKATSRTRNGDFSFAGLEGFDLHGKTMGIIGTGAIGRNVAHLAEGFGMTTLAYDLYPNPQSGLTYVPLSELLAKSDVLSLHVPDTPQTRHLLSEKEFASMKDGVVIINTARGSVLNVKALLRALKTGKVRAAGLDVLPEESAMREKNGVLRHAFAETHDLETLMADYALLHHENVIVTPHSAFFTREAISTILEVTAQNIAAFLAGKPQNVVNNPQG